MRLKNRKRWKHKIFGSILKWVVYWLKGRKHFKFEHCFCCFLLYGPAQSLLSSSDAVIIQLFPTGSHTSADFSIGTGPQTPFFINNTSCKYFRARFDDDFEYEEVCFFFTLYKFILFLNRYYRKRDDNSPQADQQIGVVVIKECTNSSILIQSFSWHYFVGRIEDFPLSIIVSLTILALSLLLKFISGENLQICWTKSPDWWVEKCICSFSILAVDASEAARVSESEQCLELAPVACMFITPSIRQLFRTSRFHVNWLQHLPLRILPSIGQSSTNATFGSSTRIDSMLHREGTSNSHTKAKLESFFLRQRLFFFAEQCFSILLERRFLIL